MKTNADENRIPEPEQKSLGIENNINELTAAQEKQSALNSLINEIISLVKKWFWLLITIFTLISICPIVFVIWFLRNEKDGVSEVIIAIIKGNISIVVACIIGLVIIICFFLITKIPVKSKKDKSIFPY